LYNLSGVFHVKRGLLAVLGVAGLIGGSSACESPSDSIYDRPAFSPIEEQSGLYRMTFGEDADVVRGFLPDGRLLIRVHDLVPFGSGWALASFPVSGTGQVREELGVYRPALLDDMGDFTTDGSRRLLTLWKAALPGIHGCPDSSMTSDGSPGPAPRTPSPVGFAVYDLPQLDGTAVAAIPSRYVSTRLVEGAGTIQQRVRVTPVMRDVDRTGVNAFGPVLAQGSVEMIYSDGDSIWRTSAADSGTAPQFIALGAYPTLSPDGHALAYARPTGLDSTVRTFTVPVGLVACIEEHIEISAAAWELVVRDLESGEEQVVADAVDPVFDPQGGRLVIRTDVLSWLDLTTGQVTPIDGTSGGFGPAISADGSVLAFSRLNGPGNSDAYFVRIR